MQYKAEWKSPIGTLTMASDGQAITGLWMEGQNYFAWGLSGDATDGRDLPIIRNTIRALEDYFQGNGLDLTSVSIMPQGTPFQRSVWAQLLDIPAGQTRTYGQIAAAVEAARGYKTSPRAVGTAIGRNPISILIPCHRVIGSDGKLTGYAGGIRRKEYLLKLENGTTP